MGETTIWPPSDEWPVARPEEVAQQAQQARRAVLHFSGMFLPEDTWHLITFHNFNHVSWLKAEYPPNVSPRLLHAIANNKPILAYVMSQSVVVWDGYGGQFTYEFVASYIPQQFFTFASEGAKQLSFCKDPNGDLMIYRGSHPNLMKASAAERLALKAYL